MSEWTYAVGDRAVDHEGPFDFPEMAKTFARHLEDAVEECAEDYFNNHDGWEASWPLTFVLFQNGKEVRRFAVDRENRPYFWANEIAGPTA